VILDAGSSGTRVYIYKWLSSPYAQSSASEIQLQHLPDIKLVKQKKVHPGISTFADKHTQVGPDHLKPLFDYAMKHVPKKSQSETPLFLLATAGMRLLKEDQQQNVLNEVCEYARGSSPFQVPECDVHIQIIPGDTEGLYGWLAANYLAGGINDPKEHDHGDGHHTYGFLDMGGASAQIAFAPNSTESLKHAEDLKLVRLRKVNGQDAEYRVFTTTWLGFGANQARARYVDALGKSTGPSVIETPDPCLPAGLKLTIAGKAMKAEDEGSPYLFGTGKFSECLTATFPLLEKEKPCNDSPCLLGGVHAPAIDFKINHFVGVSEYWHTTHEIFEMDQDGKAYDFHTYQNRVNDFCSQNWEDISHGILGHKWGKKVDEIVAEEVCFKASWLINMLHDGIGVPRIGLEKVNTGRNVTEDIIDSAKKKGFLDPFQAVDEISGTEVSWTLGKAVLYASSQIPPSGEEPLPVGFGSNYPGIAVPHDFQRPGSIDGMPDAYEFDSDWSTVLFKDSPRRVPGLLLFGFILLLAGFFLCGRDRRKVVFSRCCSFCGLGRKRKGAGPTYERVNGVTETPTGFEMPEYHSDDESYDVEAQASGWATPKGIPGDLIRADSRDRLGPLRLEAMSRINRSRSPAIKISKD
jgi:Golgi apyrase